MGISTVVKCQGIKYRLRHGSFTDLVRLLENITKAKLQFIKSLLFHFDIRLLNLKFVFQRPTFSK